MNVSEALSILWFRTTLLLNKQQILINQMSESRYEYVHTFENLNTQTSVFWRTEELKSWLILLNQRCQCWWKLYLIVFLNIPQEYYSSCNIGETGVILANTMSWIPKIGHNASLPTFLQFILIYTKWMFQNPSQFKANHLCAKKKIRRKFWRCVHQRTPVWSKIQITFQTRIPNFKAHSWCF